MYQEVMKYILIILIFYGISLNGQVMNTNSEQGIVAINGKLSSVNWHDVLTVNPFYLKLNETNQKVSFYTELDTVEFVVTEDDSRHVEIVLNEKDTIDIYVEYFPGYLHILKEGSKYLEQSPQDIPEFEYQNKNNFNLMNLNSKYKLDSIAGEGKDTDRIIKLLHWTHQITTHQDTNYSAKSSNADSLLSKCINGSTGVNCRGLATILNELYLSIGITSRIVSCMPKKPDFEESHVINAVFAKSLNKWIWIDPSFNAYLRNTNGELLSIEEVRDYVINDMSIMLNQEANYNGLPMTVDQYIGEYMVKNIYRFASPLKSEYNYESIINGKILEYVHLRPQDEYKKAQIFEEKIYDNIGLKIIDYQINDPSIFWKPPIY